MTDRPDGSDSRAITGPASLDRRRAGGEVLLLDAGIGAELEARGVPMDHDAWSAVANREHQDVVEPAHVNLVDADADILIPNTLPASLLALDSRPSGWPAQPCHLRPSLTPCGGAK